MKKRFLGLLLALCLIVGLLPVITMAADDTTAKDLVVKMVDTTVTNSTETAVNFTAKAGKVYYATTVDGKLGNIAEAAFSETAPAGGWNIKLDNTANPAVLTLDNAVLETAWRSDNAAAWENGKSSFRGVVDIAGEGALKIQVKSNSAIHLGGSGGFTTKMTGGTTISCDLLPSGERALLELVKSPILKSNTVVSAVRELVGNLTIEDANIKTLVAYNSSDTALIRDNIYAKGNLLIDNSTIKMNVLYGTGGGIKAAGNVTIQNGSDVYFYSLGGNYAVTAGDEFKIDNASLRIHNYKFDSAAYYFNKMPTLVGVTAKYNNEKTSSWDKITAWTALDVAAGTDLTGGSNKYWNYLFAPCDHANAAELTDCTVGVTCPDCKGADGNATYVIAPKSHTPGAAADCENDQLCTVCSTPLEGKLGHTGGTATCTEQARCTRCGKPHGELLPHNCTELFGCENDMVCTICNEVITEKTGHTLSAPADCRGPQVCIICGKLIAEKTEHVFTDDQDTTCNTDGCTYTRVIKAPEEPTTPPTEEPTTPPTEEPTTPPTEEPTTPPTEEPTTQPTIPSENPTTQPTTPSENPTTKPGTDNPTTGDTAPIMLVLALVAAAGMAVIILNKKVTI